MKIGWGDITPEGQALAAPLTGAPMVLSGKGCRMVLKTTDDPERRNDNLLVRLHRTAAMLTDAGAEGFSTEPREGYIRIFGGDRELYVRGDTERDVYTTLARGILTSAPEILQEVAKLDIRALTEW